MKLVRLAMVILATFTMGCREHETPAEREARIREQAAKAAAKIKPELKQAGRDIKAAAEGAKEGWKRSDGKALDLNSASPSDLETLPGISRQDARKIVANRPYRDKRELVSRNILSESEYDRIREHVDAR
jgi:DNA uptake protein ComE-like DNA-binding protein